MVTTEYNSNILKHINKYYRKKMALLEFGVQQIKQFTTDTLVLFLSKHGISQSGLKSLRDNQVEGEMLLEFTDADLKDIFEVFKDRFLIRKLLRGLYGHTNNPCRMGRTIASPVGTTQAVGTPSVPSSTSISSSSPVSTAASMVSKMNSSMTTNRLPPINTELRNAVDSYTKVSTQSDLKKDPYLSTAVTAIESLPSKMKLGSNIVRVYPNSISNHEKITSRLIAAGALRSTTIPVTNSNNISVYTVPKTLETQTTPMQSSNIKPHIIEDDDDDINDITDNDVPIIDGWGASLIKNYTAEELLRRKMRRGRPTEAQRLGRSLLREAATTANIWNTAPPLKMITADKKDAFFNYICRAAPQLSRHKQFVWIRLGEALQNRRKYLCDKECGRRLTKRRRDSDIDMIGSPHLLSMSESISTNNIITATTTTNPYSLSTPLSTPLSISIVSSAPPHSAAQTSLATSVKNEVEPIIIEPDSLPNLQDSSQTPTGGSPIETINLTTLIKEEVEVESEGMKCWGETS